MALQVTKAFNENEKNKLDEKQDVMANYAF